MISDQQKEELDVFSYLYAEDEIKVLCSEANAESLLADDPVHVQVKVSSSMDESTSPIHALLDLEWGESSAIRCHDIH